MIRDGYKHPGSRIPTLKINDPRRRKPSGASQVIDGADAPFAAVHIRCRAWAEPERGQAAPVEGATPGT